MPWSAFHSGFVSSAARCGRGAAISGALLAACCGCAGKKAQQQGAPTPAVAPSELSASPVARASENGLEVAWWVVTSDQPALAAALGPYLTRSVPLDPQTRILWEANGLRMIAVPLDRLDSVRENLTVAGAVQRQWLGQTPVWTDSVNGPVWRGNRSIALDSGRLSLGSGRLRMLTRCWTVPVPVAPHEADPSPAAALHIELLLQHQESERNGHALPLSPETETSDPTEEGLVFRRLLAEMTVTQGDAYIVVPLRPGSEWTEPEVGVGAGGAGGATGPEQADLIPSMTQEAAAGEKTESPAVPAIGRVVRNYKDSATGEQPAGSGAAGGGKLGPPEAPAISLGEALLTSAGSRDPQPVMPDEEVKKVKRLERPARAVLILIPRVPDRFRLIGN